MPSPHFLYLCTTGSLSYFHFTHLFLISLTASLFSFLSSFLKRLSFPLVPFITPTLSLHISKRFPFPSLPLIFQTPSLPFSSLHLTNAFPAVTLISPTPSLFISFQHFFNAFPSLQFPSSLQRFPFSSVFIISPTPSFPFNSPYFHPSLDHPFLTSSHVLRLSFFSLLQHPSYLSFIPSPSYLLHFLTFPNLPFLN